MTTILQAADAMAEALTKAVRDQFVVDELPWRKEAEAALAAYEAARREAEKPSVGNPWLPNWMEPRHD